MDTSRKPIEMFPPVQVAANDEEEVVGGYGGGEPIRKKRKKQCFRVPPFDTTNDDEPTIALTQPLYEYAMDEERIQHYMARLVDPEALRPIIFLLRVREDFYLLDGHHKWLALTRFRIRHPFIETQLYDGFDVDREKYLHLRTPLALVVSLLPNSKPPRHRNLQQSPYSRWCQKIVDPQPQLSERARDVGGGPRKGGSQMA